LSQRPDNDVEKLPVLARPAAMLWRMEIEATVYAIARW